MKEEAVKKIADVAEQAETKAAEAKEIAEEAIGDVRTESAKVADRVKRPAWVGAKMESSSLVILSMVPFSPAAVSELKIGDQVISINGKQVHTIQDVKERLSATGAGEKMRLVISRGGVSRSISLTLGSMEDKQAVTSR
ncbi:serine protease Do [Rhodopirellula sp. SWK7]|nr:serine protease Do [Rhodopirellula sp. SWK7]